jgi:tellurite resistance protein TehA-like permease
MPFLIPLMLGVSGTGFLWWKTTQEEEAAPKLEDDLLAALKIILIIFLVLLFFRWIYKKGTIADERTLEKV